MSCPQWLKWGVTKPSLLYDAEFIEKEITAFPELKSLSFYLRHPHPTTPIQYLQLKNNKFITLNSKLLHFLRDLFVLTTVHLASMVTLRHPNQTVVLATALYRAFHPKPHCPITIREGSDCYTTRINGSWQVQ